MRYDPAPDPARPPRAGKDDVVIERWSIDGAPSWRLSHGPTILESTDTPPWIRGLTPRTEITPANTGSALLATLVLSPGDPDHRALAAWVDQAPARARMRELLAAAERRDAAVLERARRARAGRERVPV